MKNPQEKSLKEVWETEEIRVLVLTSLVIQALLTFFAPRRKYSSNSWNKLFIWMLYLLADAVAIYTIGLISNNKGHHFTESLEILALWGSFLLLHLGGPDTITALALEDNELWRRHALQLATQVSVTVYVFVRSFQYHTRNRLWIPTVLMFIDGLIKYFERTCALFFASRDNFRDSIMGKPEAGPNYARLMEEYYSARSAHVPARFQEDDTKGKKDQANDDEKKDEEQNLQPNSSARGNEDSSVHPHRPNDSNPEKMVQDAHLYYAMYKPLLAEGFLSLKDRATSREFFLSKPAKEAFMIIQIELNLIYDAFYTKSFLLRRRRAVARVLCFAFVIVSLVLFCWNWDLKEQKTDAIVTLILFIGAIALDISAATMFVLSDWWIIISDDRRKNPRLSWIMGSILRYLRCLGSTCSRCLRFIICYRCKKRHQNKRWSKNICEYNLLKYCFRKRPCLLIEFKWININKIKFVRDMIIEFLYVTSKALEKQNDDGLEDFIIKEIRRKAEQAHDPEVAKDVFSARGNLVLEDDYYLVSEYLSPWTTDLDYDESLMIWHLATDICYWRTPELIGNEAKHRRYSKKLSDYMLYLVIWQQSLLSSVVGMSETRFQDTCAEAKKFNDNEEINISWLRHLWLKAKECRWRCPPRRVETEELKFFKNFSDKLFEVKAVIEPMVAKGDKSKSVLFDACRLAKQLEMFDDRRWEIISKVWLELLCYAAVRCSPRYHIAQLSKGGELITLVWLYMAHLGLGERFLKNQGFGSTKLVIEK